MPRRKNRNNRPKQPQKKAAQPHDAAYKLLFSHPAMVADLLKGYLAREWIGELDLNRLEAVAESHLSDDLRERRNDCIWRVPWRDPAGGDPVWLYVYLILEFQSRVDETMAVRMLVYLGLLYQDLLRAREITPDALPPVLPVVLYNGQDRWTAPVQLAAQVPRFPAALAPYIPRVQYLFLDEGRMTRSGRSATWRRRCSALSRTPPPTASKPWRRPWMSGSTATSRPPCAGPWRPGWSNPYSRRACPEPPCRIP